MKKFKRGDGYIGGVAQGLGEYSNIDPLFWRLAFVFAFGPILYVIMWMFTKKQVNN